MFKLRNRNKNSLIGIKFIVKGMSNNEFKIIKYDKSIDSYIIGWEDGSAPVLAQNLHNNFKSKEWKKIYVQTKK